MKNTGPPHRTNHKMAPGAGSRPAALRLTPDLNRFIQHMGAYFEGSGVPRIGGLILGLLIVSHEPLSAEQIASTLKISRASISTNFRLLSASGLAERFTSHADRMTYYTFPVSAWEQILHMGTQRTLAFKRIIQEGLAAVPKQDIAHHRLELADDLSDSLLELYRKVVEDWQVRYSKAPGQPLG
jgi:DNA-binding transcriptional regulator GbsR (MarR family)